MPALSPTMEKGNLAKWLKKEGDKIKSGDVIAEIETDKATMEYEAVDEGTLAKIVVPAGTQDVAVNAVIAVLAGEGEDVKAAASAAKVLRRPRRNLPPHPSRRPLRGLLRMRRRERRSSRRNLLLVLRSAARSGRLEGRRPDAHRQQPHLLFPARAPAGERGRRRSQPRAGLRSAWPRDRARHRRGEIRPGPARADCGDGGRHADGRVAVRRADPRAVRGRLLRLRPARQHAQDHRAAPHAVEADHPAFLSDARLRHRQAAWPRARRSTPPRRSRTASRPTRFRSTISSSRRWRWRLQRVPDANVTWTESGMLHHKHSDVGVAVAIPGGLITPVVRQAEAKSLSTISNEMKDYAARARTRHLKPQEYQGGSTAISNLGMYGIKDFAAVINPPHATILAVGAGEERAVVRNGAARGRHYHDGDAVDRSPRRRRRARRRVARGVQGADRKPGDDGGVSHAARALDHARRHGHYFL